MQKPATTDHPVHDVIRTRWSPRAFAATPVPPDVVRSLIEAARWSASCYNEQPWAFVVATKDQPELYAKVLGCLVEFNQGWAKSAPVLILAFAHKVFTHNGKPNIHGVYDLGQAMAQLTAEATSRGLFVHQMAGIEYDKIRSEFAVPADWEPMSAAAVGHDGDPETLPDSLKGQELATRSRKKPEAFVFGGTWGEPSPIAEGS